MSDLFTAHDLGPGTPATLTHQRGPRVVAKHADPDGLSMAPLARQYPNPQMKIRVRHLTAAEFAALTAALAPAN